MTMDVPVFAQSTVDQTDEFSRKLSLYARGQIGHLDYRLSFTDPFPITSSGAAPQPIANFANFSPIGHRKQYQAYLMWQFFDHEGHNTPFMPGTYLARRCLQAWQVQVAILKLPVSKLPTVQSMPSAG